MNYRFSRENSCLLRKIRTNPEFNSGFVRGNEVDLLVDHPDHLTAIELKSGATIAADFFRGLNYFSSVNTSPTNKVLVYGGKQEQQRSDGTVIRPWNKLEGLV